MFQIILKKNTSLTEIHKGYQKNESSSIYDIQESQIHQTELIKAHFTRMFLFLRRIGLKGFKIIRFYILYFASLISLSLSLVESHSLLPHGL